MCCNPFGYVTVLVLGVSTIVTSLLLEIGSGLFVAATEAGAFLLEVGNSVRCSSHSSMILVFGLPEAGKTTFAKRLIKGTDFAHFNADEVRGMFNDWDFSEEGRRRQAQRMLALCTMANKTSVVDFICPFDIFRHPYDIKIWINTIDQSHYKDTNKMLCQAK